MSKLEELELQANELTGSFPPEWINMTQLQTLHLWSNRFCGPLPSQWSKMQVRELHLNNNQNQRLVATRMESYAQA